MEINRTIGDDRTVWTLTIDGSEVAALSVRTDKRRIGNVRTVGCHEGKGYARALYERTQAEFVGRVAP